jgi:hypothetical protein
VRRRVVREIGTISGIVLILGVVVLTAGFFRRSTSWEKFERIRKVAEAAQREGGVDLLGWDVLQATKGTYRSGPSFQDALKARDGSPVHIIGYQVPDEEFRAMHEFMLLPVPIECYFCESPPMRDVVYVRMKEGTTADLVNEPILINGILRLHDAPKSDYFYVIEDAAWGKADESQRLTPKYVPQEHRLGGHAEQPVMEEGYELDFD